MATVCRVDRDQNKKLIEALSSSQIYQDYEKAFSRTTGLPLSLRPIESWNLAHAGKKNENPFCALLAENNRACASCLETQAKIASAVGAAPRTVKCFAGLCDTGVPVSIGEELLGFLQTGQVMLNKPSRAQFSKVVKQLVDWGWKVDLRRLEESYFQTRVLTPKEYESVLRLLTIFAQHLALVSNQLLVRSANSEPPAITKAKQFIQEHQADEISLADVAKAVNTSTFYFCKMFKKATGINFTEYLARVRVEKARNLLLNPNLRISEVAFAAGFQSLSHFNRVFRRIAGESPTRYREKLPAS
ncbi:MAG: helix-turn-helix domain-containing protein [Verrucomicrobia bacterium]|nr:MAG: helix-turn-helix domain-containing protein [Verrucomicrobiota bacterium]